MEFSAVVNRVRSEFLEMPGLCLTPAQAMRLWGVNASVCQEVIAALIAAAFLRWSADGKVMVAE